MSDPVTLLLPAEAPYRALGPALARKYIEIAGGSASDAAAGENAVAAAADRVAGGAKADGEMTLSIALETGRVEIRARCGGESAVVTQALPARP